MYVMYDMYNDMMRMQEEYEYHNCGVQFDVYFYYDSSYFDESWNKDKDSSFLLFLLICNK